MIRRIAFADSEAHRDHALLIFARDAGKARRFLDARNIADAHHLGLVAERRFHFEILEIVGRDAGVPAVDNINREILSVERCLRDFGFARQLRRDELNHLTDGQPLIDRLFLVHRNAHFGHGRFKPVADVLRAVDRAHDVRHVRSDRTERVHIVAAHVYGDACSGQHRDVHRAGLDGKVELHIVRNRADIARNVHIVASRVGIDDDII